MKNYNAKTRKQIIALAIKYGCKNSEIEYLSFNSNVTDEYTIASIHNFHIEKVTLKRLFRESVAKAIPGLQYYLSPENILKVTNNGH